MPSDSSLLPEVAGIDPQSATKDASLAETPYRPSVGSHASPTRTRDMTEPGTSGLGHEASSDSLAQFSFAPATRTTVVTTTTTTTTTFPPLVIKSPRATRSLDPKLYPLASAPTPASLRDIKFELDGKSIIFKEPEDTTSAFKEVSFFVIILGSWDALAFFAHVVTC